MLHRPRLQARAVSASGVAAQRWAIQFGLAAVIGSLYFLAARLGLFLLTELDGVAVFWPAAGVSAGALVALGPAARLPVVVGVLAATVAANLAGDRNLASAVVFALCNAGEALLMAWLIQRHFGSDFSLDSFRRVVGLLVAASMAGAASGVGGALGFVLFHGSTVPFLFTWYHWFASDALGIVTVAPLVIGLVRTGRDLPKPLELVEAAAALMVFGAVSVISFASPTRHWVTILPLALLLPSLFWLAARCRPVFAAAAVFIVTVTVVWTVTFGIGRLGDPSASLAGRIQAGQTAVLAIAWCALALAGLFAERLRQEAALAERGAHLALVEKTALVGSYAFDMDAGRVQISPGCAAIHGFPEGTGEIRRDDWRAGVQPDDLVRYDALLSQAISARQSEHHLEYRICRSSGEVRWIEARAFILFDPDGRPERVVGINIDVTERKNAEVALAERDAQLALAGQTARVGSYVKDLATGTMQISPGYATIHGLSVGTTETTADQWRTRVHPDDLGWLDASRKDVVAERRHEHNAEYRIFGPDGNVRWIEARALISYDDDGHARRVIGINIDVTDRKRGEEHQRLLIAELDHRVKNVLANVAVVARRTSERSRSARDFMEALDRRLQSMADAHSLLSRSRWQSVSLADLVDQELAPFATSGNTTVEGSHVGLTPAATQAMAMVLHELATNAAKYGALSTPQGRVSVRWGRSSNGGAPATLAVVWHEEGGPAVPVPAQTGYGTSIIRDLIPYELGGTVELDFSPDGVRCIVVLPGEQTRQGNQAGGPSA